ncbi:MAG: VTT domain-containing protein [Candidatus Woesearchaeota archaeon]
MISDLSNWLLELIKSHGILAVIFGVLLETIIVPLPSPLILMAAGYILIPHTNIINIISTAFLISFVAGLTQTIGSFLLYLPGFYIGKPFIQKYKKFHGLEWKDIEHFQKKFDSTKEEISIFFLRALPIIPLSIISGLSGILKIDFKKYTIATFLGTLPRNMILVFSGFFLGEFYMQIAKKIDNAESIMTIVIIALIIIYLILHKTGFIEKIRKKI